MHGPDITPIALMLFFAFVGGFLLHRLRQPALVGYILVGALLGPLLFHGSESTIEAFAELAIIMLMFMLGLELDIKRFRRAMEAALWVTTLQIVLSLGVMFGLGLLFDWPWQLAVLLGFAAAISSTAVAVSMMQSLGKTNKPSGRLATAILVAQDLAVVPMLLIITALGAGSVNGFQFAQLGISLGVIAVTLIGIFELYQHPRWVARIERIVTTGTHQPVIAALAFAFGAAALSGAIGLSAAYGAFVVGLMIGNLGTIGASYRHAVHSIHDFLMMTFFLSIGLLLDVPFVISHIGEIIVALVAIMVIKIGINIGILNLFLSVPRRSAVIAGSILGQIGEFSFILIGLGLAQGFINSEDYQLVLAVIALSLVTSPIISQLTLRYFGNPNPAPAIR